MSAPRPRWIAPLAGWLCLQALMAVRYPWERESFLHAFGSLSPDLLGLALVVFLLRRRAGARSLAHVLAAGALLVPLYRLGYSAVPALFGKPFELYHDAPRARDVLHLVVHTQLHREALWLQLLAGLLALLLLAGVHVLVRRLVRPTLEVRRPGVVVVVCGVLGVLYGTERLAGVAPGPGRWQPGMYAEVVEGGRSIVRGRRLREELGRRVAAAHDAMRGVDTNLARLQGADVVVAFVESYGRALFRHPGARARLAAAAAVWQRELEQDGIQVLSAFTFPAVRGGGSELAHAQFQSGVEIDSRRVFEMLLDTDVKALPHYFVDAGYRTYNVQPVMYQEWPRGKFFGFQHDLFQSAFADYRGHVYPWGRVPDQYALERLRREILAAPTPAYAQFVSVTSHAPFAQVPPYYADWSRAAAAAAFQEGPARRYDIHWLNYVGHPQVEEAYVETVCYSLRVLTGFVQELPRRCLLLVLGDHQPPAAGALMEADGSYDVPVHVLSRDPALLFPFHQSGFQPGFVPPDDAGSFPSTLFHSRLLALFSTPAPAAGGG